MRASITRSGLSIHTHYMVNIITDVNVNRYNIHWDCNVCEKTLFTLHASHCYLPSFPTLSVADWTFTRQLSVVRVAQELEGWPHGVKYTMLQTAQSFFHLPNALAALDRLQNQFVCLSVSQSVTQNELNALQITIFHRSSPNLAPR